MKISYINDTAILEAIAPFDLARSCTCGQAFRWKRLEAGFMGIVLGRYVYVEQKGAFLYITPCDEGDIAFWINYFDLGRNYALIERDMQNSPVLKQCLAASSGIRIFNQDPFETMISFILSANNNMKRIMGIIENLCRTAGEAFMYGGCPYYAFPTPAALAQMPLDDLKKIGAGYRAPYIKAAAGMAADGYDLNALRGLEIGEARRRLYDFPGVGPKVADCVLLFALGYSNAFPVDVWIDRAMRVLFFDGNCPSKKELQSAIDALGPESGILQQHIFHYARAQKIRSN